MLRLFRLYKEFIRSSLRREASFRVNFISKVLENAVWMGFFLLIVFVLYYNTDSIAGWTRGDAYILTATTFLLWALVRALFSLNLMEIPEKVRKGSLDYDLVKPVDTQFLVSFRKFNFDEVGSLVVGFVLVWLGVRTGGYSPALWHVGEYLLLLGCGIAIFYAFDLFIMTLGIWLVRVENLWALSEQIIGIARMPLEIFGMGVRRVLTYVVPLAFLAWAPSKALMGSLNVSLIFWGVAWAVCALVFSRLFFRFALRHYTSASS